MRIVIAGGSGQVGTILARAFHRDGHGVVVLSRHPQMCPWRCVEWNGQTLGDWQREIDGSDVVINLAGRSVNCRYNARNRRDILQSRTVSTLVIGEAIADVTLMWAAHKGWLGGMCAASRRVARCSSPARADVPLRQH